MKINRIWPQEWKCQMGVSCLLHPFRPFLLNCFEASRSLAPRNPIMVIENHLKIIVITHNSYNENCANANQLTATIACFLIWPNIEHRVPWLRQLLVPLAHSSPRQRRVFSMIVTSTRNWLLLELRLIIRNIILGNIFRQQSTKISTYNYVCQAQITYKTVIESSVSSIIKHWLKFSL